MILLCNINAFEPTPICLQAHVDDMEATSVLKKQRQTHDQNNGGNAS